MKKLFPRSLLIAVLFRATYSLNAQPYIIPVVFHVLHQGGTENISDAQILDAMRILNEDYNKENADTIDVIPYYQNNIADMQVQFRLANIDPNGNCTNGIERIYSTLTNWGSDYAKIHDWSRDKYLNIWVVKYFSQGIAAYSYYPWKADSIPAYDGIIILNSYVGSIGTSSFTKKRTLTYEIGKYLGLYKTSQFTYCNNGPQFWGEDSVVDTPPANIWMTSCTNLYSLSCDTTVIENVQNFMSYAYCTCMFTNGQKSRIHDWLNSNTAQRNNLWSNTNLLITGTNNAVQNPCAPICDFKVSSNFVCQGNPVTFTDKSYNGIVTSRLWSFTNANVSTSTDSVVVVTFNNTGWQAVTLNVMNGNGSSTVTKAIVYVSSNTSLATPYYNNFDDENEFNQNWASFNPDADAAQFTLANNVNHSGSHAVLLNNYSATNDGTYDEFYSPAFDCSTLDTGTGLLNFQYSYATQANPFSNTNIIDSMQVLGSTNCGTTWTSIYKKGRTNLINAGTVSTYFNPGNTFSFWKQESVVLPTVMRVNNVRFKFKVWGSHNSNNFYLDDFILGPLSTNIAETATSSLSIIPNPFNSSIRINGIHEGAYNIWVFDITGREVKRFDNIYSSDDYLNLDLSSVSAKGVYVLRVIGEDKSSASLKLVKQ